MEIFSEKLRITFIKDEIHFRVIGENEEKGVPEALEIIKKLEQHLALNNRQYTVYKRKGPRKKEELKPKKIVDAIIIPVMKK